MHPGKRNMQSFQINWTEFICVNRLTLQSWGLLVDEINRFARLYRNGQKSYSSCGLECGHLFNYFCLNGSVPVGSYDEMPHILMVKYSQF